MNIYFSNFRNVDLKNETTEGIDYSEAEKETEYFLSRYDELTKASPEENSDDFNDLLMQSFDSPLARSKTDSLTTQSTLSNCQEPLTESELDRSIKDNINELL